MSRVTSTDRVIRLLSIIPWIAAHDGPTVDEICERFDISRNRLLKDLEIIPFVGVYPRTPDALIELVTEDDRVWVRYTPVFERPLRIAPVPALTLVARGQSLLSVPGADTEGPLARGLEKLAATLDLAATDAVDVRLELVPEATLDQLRAAVGDHHQVEIDYYSYNRDRRSRRTVDPHRVYSEGGQWYVSGHCHQAGDIRLFRIDRIQELKVLESMFAQPADAGPNPVFEPRPEHGRVTLDLKPRAHWVVEQYPTESVESRPGEVLRATLAVSAQGWLERLLVRLGDDVQLVSADAGAGGPDIGRMAARRILARYGA